MKLFFVKKSVLNQDEKKQRSKNRKLLILSGAMLGLSFPPFPFPFQFLMFFALIPFFFVIEKKKTLLEINKAMFLTAFIFCMIGVYWVGSWQSKADSFLMMGGGVLLFFLPSLYMIISTLFYLSRKLFKEKAALFLFPLLWVTLEHLLAITEFSFPWLTLGQGLSYFTLFIQIADIVGALGLSLIVLYLNIFIYKSILFFKDDRKKSAYWISMAGILFGAVIIYGSLRISTINLDGKSIRVGVIQPNIDPWEKWKVTGLKPILSNYFELSQRAVNEKIDLLIWPETALPVYLLNGGYTNHVDSIYSFIKKNNVFLLTGMPHVEFYFDKDNHPEDAKQGIENDFWYRTYNSVLMLSPYNRSIQRYGKMKLVPLGEHTPYVDKIPFLGDLLKWSVGLSGWNFGQDTIVFKMPLVDFDSSLQSPIIKDTLYLSGLVCFESVFPDFVAGFVDRGAQFITIVTNDSWYGKSSGPYQHKEIGVLRAVENRRSVVRCANGGISCIINPIGITEKETELFKRTFLTGDVKLNFDKTFYTKYPLIIPVVALAFSMWIFGINILLWLKKKLKL